MINIYKPDNKNFEYNGDSILNPTSMKFTAAINGVWTVSMDHPIDDKSVFIVENAVIKCDTPEGNGQLFRIKTIDKTEFNISAVAEPIALDAANDCFLYDVRPTEKTGQEALDIILANSNYNGHSNIYDLKTSYFIRKNAIEAINGNDENSFLNRWGGEIHYNNFDITINKRIGSNFGVRAAFGLNISGIKINVDTCNVVTRIIPVGFNGITLDNNGYVESNKVSKYPIVYYKTIEYSDVKLKSDSSDDEGFDTFEEAQAELIRRANIEFQNGIDIPEMTIDVNMEDVSKTNKYSDVEELLKIHLGDDITATYEPLNINLKKRVVQYTYDVIQQKVENVILGDSVKNYFDRISSIVGSAEKVIDTSNSSLMADKIKGIINLMNTSLRAQKDIAERQDVRAILFEDLDSSSPTFGAMCIGTQGIQISKKRNESNSDWIWGTAIDFKSIYAEHIITGILSDQKGNNHWNLETGELTTKNMTAENGTFSGKLESPTINGGSIKGSTITGGNITSNTNINVNTDLRVGNNIYIGSYDDRDTKKYIYLNDRFAIASRNSILAFGVENGDLYKGKLYVTSSGGVIMNSGIAQVTVGSQDASIFCNSTCHITVGKNNIEINPNNDLIVRSNLILDNVRFISGRTTSGSSVGMLVRGDDNNVYVGYYNNGTIIRGSFCKLGSASGATITSDKNLKRDIFDMSKKYENFFMGLKPVSYKYCTNNHKRDHVGFVAQDVESAMNNAGLNSEQFAGLCIDEVENYEVLTEDDDMKYLANKGISKIYSLRYEEFIALNTHMIQNLYKMVDKQNKEIEKLKEEIRCLSLEEKD